VYAVAQAIVDDKEDTKNIRSIISTVVSSPALLELCQLLSASGVDVSSIVELIERGDLTKIAAIRAECPTLLEDIVRLRPGKFPLFAQESAVVLCTPTRSPIAPTASGMST
jgi:hypothetical protein